MKTIQRINRGMIILFLRAITFLLTGVMLFLTNSYGQELRLYASLSTSRSAGSRNINDYLRANVYKPNSGASTIFELEPTYNRSQKVLKFPQRSSLNDSLSNSVPASSPLDGELIFITDSTVVDGHLKEQDSYAPNQKAPPYRIDSTALHDLRQSPQDSALSLVPFSAQPIVAPANFAADTIDQPVVSTTGDAVSIIYDIPTADSSLIIIVVDSTLQEITVDSLDNEIDSLLSVSDLVNMANSRDNQPLVDSDSVTDSVTDSIGYGPLIDIIADSTSQPSGSKALGAMDTKLLYVHEVDSSQYYTFFRVGATTIDINYRNNSYQRDMMEVLVNDLLNRTDVVIDSIVVYGAASPEGDSKLNQKLALERCNTVKNYISRAFLRLDERKIKTYSKGEDWVGLKNAVMNDPDVPYKEEVLNILDVSSNRESREFFLRGLRDGAAWRYITDYILPDLRNGTASKVYYSKFLLKTGTLTGDTIMILPELAGRGIDSSNVRIQRDTINTSIFRNVNVYRPQWAVKTNLLYWAAAQPNVEFEFYFGNNWSLNFEYQVAWWKNTSKHQYYQYTQCAPEGRYWFKGDGNFQGHYIGLHVGFGIYDLSWGNAPDYQGYQGEFAIALGISYGYTWKLGKVLYLEAGLGFGYIMTEYRRYRYIDECYVYQGTERMQFLGPTKARLTLQWRIGSGANKKTKGWTR